LPPPTGPEQIKDLLAFFRGLAPAWRKEPDDALDGFFHAVETGEGRNRFRTVRLEKNSAKA